MEVGNSMGIAGRADLPEDIAALDLLARLDVRFVQMAVVSPPKGLTDEVLHHYAVSTMPGHEDEYDCPVSRSNHRIAPEGVEVKARMRCRSPPQVSAPAYTRQIAVVRRDPRGALCRAPGKRDRIEHYSGGRNSLPSAEVSAPIVPGESAVDSLAHYADRDVSDAGPGVQPGPQRPQRPVVRGQRAPGESQCRPAELAALVEHALLD